MNGAWGEKHKNTYAGSDWIDKPSIFAETAITYFPETGNILDLGAGQGQDSRYFATHGYMVVSTDLEESALELSRQKLPDELASRVLLQRVDLRKRLPFEDKSFDIVYAHLSLHYFDVEGTESVFTEIRRVLRPGGVVAFLVNSTSDPEYRAGHEIETDYYEVDDATKRFFTIQAAGTFAWAFKTLLLDNQGETYKDTAKGVHNLIRFIGTNQE